jgi:hypothetical protein
VNQDLARESGLAPAARAELEVTTTESKPCTVESSLALLNRAWRRRRIELVSPDRQLSPWRPRGPWQHARTGDGAVQRTGRGGHVSGSAGRVISCSPIFGFARCGGMAGARDQAGGREGPRRLGRRRRRFLFIGRFLRFPLSP